MDNETHFVNSSEPAAVVELDLLAQLWPLYVSSAVVVTVLGMSGNILVIYAISSNKRLHTVSNVFILNLAVADILFLLLCPFFFAFITQSDWPQNAAARYGCKLFYYSLHCALYAAIYSLVTIAIIRYIAIAHEAKSRPFRTRKNCAITVVILWLVILLANIPIFQSYTIVEWSGYTFCYTLTDELGLKICMVFFTFSYVLPLLLISLVSLATHVSMAGSGIDEASCEQRRRRASKLLGTVVIVFAGLWLPVQVDQLLTFFSLLPFTVDYELVRLFFFLLAFINSAINPIIYNFTSQNFRLAFQEVLCRKTTKVQPDTTRTLTTQLHSIRHKPCRLDVRVFRVQMETGLLIENTDKTD